MHTISCNRLLLRQLEVADAEQTQRLFLHWEIVQFLNTKIPWPFPADGALTYYRDVAIPAMERGDEWHWTLRLKESPDQLIGVIDILSKFRGRLSARVVDFGWHFPARLRPDDRSGDRGQ